jgi:hypothetical protein
MVTACCLDTSAGDVEPVQVPCPLSLKKLLLDLWGGEMEEEAEGNMG